jgi:cytoskeleton protein RodZ
LPSFGEKLKLEREKRKITLEDISVSTKIGTRMLQALEEDKFNQLPGGIFNKGFVRAYSRFVGLDEDQTVAEYLQASGDAPPPRTEIVSRESEDRDDDHDPRESNKRENGKEDNVSILEATSDGPRSVPWGLFAAILLVVALALFFWTHHQRQRAKATASPSPSEAAEPSPSAQSSAGGATEPSKEVKEAKEKLGPRSSASGSAATSTTAGPSAASINTRPVASTATKTLQNPTTSTSTTTASISPAPGAFMVTVKAREECWLSITADGKTLESELLPAGGERIIQGKKEIIVKAGNAGGVDFLLNGKKLNTLGDYGEVKTVTFGPGGILPNAPAPPSTP